VSTRIGYGTGTHLIGESIKEEKEERKRNSCKGKGSKTIDLNQK
jgi:hypothetical protein